MEKVAEHIIEDPGYFERIELSSFEWSECNEYFDSIIHLVGVSFRSTDDTVTIKPFLNPATSEQLAFSRSLLFYYLGNLKRKCPEINILFF